MPPVLIEKLIDLSFSSIKPIEAFLPLPNSLLFVIGRREGGRREGRKEEGGWRREGEGMMDEGGEEKGEEEGAEEGGDIGEEEGKGGRRERGGGEGGGRRDGGGGGGVGRREGGGMSRYQLFCEVWDLKTSTIVSEMMLDAYGVKYLCDFVIYEDNVIMNVKSTFGVKKIFFLDVLTKKRWSSKIELRGEKRGGEIKKKKEKEEEGGALVGEGEEVEGGKKEEAQGGELERKIGGEVEKQGGEGGERGERGGEEGERGEEGKEIKEQLLGKKEEERRREKEEGERMEEGEKGREKEGIEEVLKSGLFRIKMGKIVYYEVISMIKPMISKHCFDHYTLILLEVYSYDASRLDIQLKLRRPAIKKEQNTLISILKEDDFILIWDGFSNEITIWDLLHPSDIYYFSANFSGMKPLKFFFPPLPSSLSSIPPVPSSIPPPSSSMPPPSSIPPFPSSIPTPSSSISLPFPLVFLLVKEQSTKLIKVLTLNLKENTILSRNIMKIEELLDQGDYLDTYKVKILFFKKIGKTKIAFPSQPSLLPLPSSSSFPPSSYYSSSEEDLSQILEGGREEGGKKLGGEGKGVGGGVGKENEIKRKGGGSGRERVKEDKRRSEGGGSERGGGEKDENRREGRESGREKVEQEEERRKKEEEGRREAEKEEEGKEKEEDRLYLLIMLQMRGKLEYLKYFLYTLDDNEESGFKFVWKCQKENQINYGFEAKEEFAVCRTEGGDGGIYLRIFFLDE